MDQKTGLIKTYAYDPMDRLTKAHTGPKNHEQFFYNRERLITEKEGGVSRSLMHVNNQLLAQTYVDNQSCEKTLLSANRQSSVLHSVSALKVHTQAFTPFGYHHTPEAMSGLPGFNGERPDPLTGHYHLGKGHRAYNPYLMRFNSPDQLSPFDAGGLNAYAYCTGDPVNRSDPSGRASDNDILLAGLAVVGVLAGGHGLYYSIKAARKAVAAELVVAAATKVASSTLAIAGGLVGSTRLMMGLAGDETGRSGMIAAQVILTMSAFGLLVFGSGRNAINARRQKKLGNITKHPSLNVSSSSTSPPTLDTPLSSTSSGWESSSNNSGSNAFASAPSKRQRLQNSGESQNEYINFLTPRSGQKQITTKSSLVRSLSI